MPHTNCVHEFEVEQRLAKALSHTQDNRCYDYFCEYPTPVADGSHYGCSAPGIKVNANTFRCRAHLPLALNS